MSEKFYIINKDVLPAVFEKVVYAKRLLSTNECKTINDAVKCAGISRSVFYKYKDDVSVYVGGSSDHILNLNLLLYDGVGLLSNLLTLLSNSGASILTINQNIPTDDIAPVSISMTVQSLSCTIDELIIKIKKLDGVLKVDLIKK